VLGGNFGKATQGLVDLLAPPVNSAPGAETGERRAGMADHPPMTTPQRRHPFRSFCAAESTQAHNGIALPARLFVRSLGPLPRAACGPAPSSLLFKGVLVDLLQVEGLAYLNAEVVADHQLGQLFTVDEP
jgi:hypothetical protein